MTTINSTISRFYWILLSQPKLLLTAKDTARKTVCFFLILFYQEVLVYGFKPVGFQKKNTKKTKKQKKQKTKTKKKNQRQQQQNLLCNNVTIFKFPCCLGGLDLTQILTTTMVKVFLVLTAPISSL